MGYMAIFQVLNDLASDFEKSPHAYAFMLANAYSLARGLDDVAGRHVWEHACQIASEHGEPRPHPQALEAISCFHADERKFFLAHGNCTEDLGWPVKYGVAKDRKTGEEYQTVTLRMPEYEQKAWKRRKEEEAKKKAEKAAAKAERDQKKAARGG
jgi:hypothetical protein